MSKLSLRDKKKRNIFLRNERIKLGNIGLKSYVVQKVTAITKSQCAADAALYVSPEVLKDVSANVSSLNKSTDIW